MESRVEPSLTKEGSELLNEVVCERLESAERHCDEQLVTCSISTVNPYVSTTTFETWVHTNILQTAAEEAVQMSMIDLR